MLFWVFCALLTAAGLAMLLRPLVSARTSAREAEDANVAIYRDQLEEIERDHERGLLNEEEAESARVEVSRRLLAATELSGADAGDAAAAPAGVSYERMSIAIAAAVVAFSLATYLFLGSPGYPSKPHAQRRTADVTKLPVDELIARVEARLKENPEDARGWDVVAPVYLRRREYAKAARAFQQAIRLNGESDRRLAQFAEAILGATNGQVTDAVKSTYERLLVLRPDFLPAHFWLAIRHEQDGDAKTAQAAYSKLLARKNLSAEMRQLIRERFAAVSGGKADPKAGAAPTIVGKGDSPSADARQEMARLSPAQRQKRIRAMVEGLAERLKADGGELSEWQRLIRAYTVLGDTEKAGAAYAEARKAFAKQPDTLAQLVEFASGLGLKLNPDAK